jgi:hypothetical protein
MKELTMSKRFAKGQPAGPGRPRGSRNKATIWLDEIGLEGIESVINKVKDKANEGDMRAASIVLARAWPRRRGRTMTLELPPVDSADGVVRAQAELVARLADGEITPEEAASVSALLENQRRAIESQSLAGRIEALEEAARRRKRGFEDDSSDEAASEDDA